MAAFMAGGSLAVLPPAIDKELLMASVGMKPVKSSIRNEYILSNGKSSMVYNTETKKLEKR
jgi:hypothetical protein